MTKKKSSERLTRRRFIQTGAAATASAATLGSTDSFGPSLVQDADALAATTAVALGGGAVVGAAGIKLMDYVLDSGEPDTNALEDSLYNAGLVAAENRKMYEKEVEAKYKGVPAESTPFGNAAWSTVRSEVVKARKAGKSRSDAQMQAKATLDKQATRAIVNVVERFNTFITSMKPHITADVNNSVGVFTGVTSAADESIESRTNGVVTQAEGPNGYFYKYQSDEGLDLPAPVDEIKGRSGPMTIWGIGTHTSMTERYRCLEPMNGNFGAPDTHNVGGSKIKITHSDLPTEVIFRGELYKIQTGKIYSAYDSVTDSLATYVDNVYTGMAQGGIQVEELMTPMDLHKQFSSSDQQQRVAAELAAVGADVPDDMGMEVLISHPSLSANQLWVHLYPMLTDSGKSKDIAPGTTLLPEDYDIAYIGFHAADTDEYKTKVLDGSSELSILDVSNVEGETSADASGQVGSNGKVTVWDTDSDGDAPKGLTNADTSIVVKTENSRSAHSGDELTENSGVYTLSSTSLSEGAKLTAIKIVPNPTYEQPTKHVADPSNPDPEVTRQQVENYEELAKEIDGMNTTGAGFLPNLGGLPSWAIAAGAAGLGYLLLDDN